MITIVPYFRLTASKRKFNSVKCIETYFGWVFTILHLFEVAGVLRRRGRAGRVDRGPRLDHQRGAEGAVHAAVVWVRERKVLSPGVSTLVRLAAGRRETANQRLWGRPGRAAGAGRAPEP